MRLSNNQKDVLKAIGQVSLIAAASMVSPNLLQILKPKSRQKKYYFKKTIEKLVDNKIIYLFGEEIRLTPRGQQLLARVEAEEIVIPKGQNWDGVWHLVCYDIPEKRKKERNYFQKKLLESGFWAVQDSLWVYHWNCKEEIAVISQNLGISPFVAYLNTDYLPGQTKLTKRFGLYSNKP